MTSPHILAFDLGTGGNKASLLDADGKLVASAFVPYETIRPEAGRHEQRPQDWWNAVVESTRRLFESCSLDSSVVACLAISGHSLGCVPLAGDGTLLRESTPIWSDKRPDQQVERFFQGADPKAWYEQTGNGFPPAHYTVFKAMWYRDEEPEMFRRMERLVGTKDYINFRLTGRMATDPSYASGSGVYDLRKWDYAEELISASGLPRKIFPEILPSTEILGTLTSEAAGELGLPKGVKVACGGVDNSCMALGADNTRDGSVYASLGSSAWIAVSSDTPLIDEGAKPYVFTHVIPGLFTSAVAIFSSGTSFQWVRDRMCRDVAGKAVAEGRDPYEAMTALAAASPAGANRLLFCPGLAGGSSLDGSPHLRGAFVGLDLAHTQGDVIRSAMEGIALNLRLALDVLRELCPVRDEMIVVGGSSRSALWRQIFADAWRMKIRKTAVGQEAGSLGAGALAAVGAGIWRDFSPISRLHGEGEIAVPEAERVDRYESLLPVFREACRAQAQLGEMLHGL